jgi:hypothetical protein
MYIYKDQKEEKARIKVEHVIREDFIIEAYELLELLCELVYERVKYIGSQKVLLCDKNMFYISICIYMYICTIYLHLIYTMFKCIHTYISSNRICIYKSCGLVHEWVK